MSGKRQNTFAQGKPERPYMEREEEAPDPPQRATAAQMATRKIRTAKPRRAHGHTNNSELLFATPEQSTLNFNAAVSSTGNNTAPAFSIGNGNAFGSNANNSFPPSQPAAPGNSFANQSFPAFGSNSQTTGFNPQTQSTSFNFGAAGGNPFASLNNSQVNGATSTPSFGSSIFSASPAANPFANLQSKNTTSAGPVLNMFGTSGSAPTGGLFGSSTPSAPNAAVTPAPTAFNFGSTTATVQNAASVPTNTSIFSGFGNSQSQSAAPPARATSFFNFDKAATTGRTESSASTNTNAFSGNNLATTSASGDNISASTGAFGGSNATLHNPSSGTVPSVTNAFSGSQRPAIASSDSSITGTTRTPGDSTLASLSSSGSTFTAPTPVFSGSDSATTSDSGRFGGTTQTAAVPAQSNLFAVPSSSTNSSQPLQTSSFSTTGGFKFGTSSSQTANTSMITSAPSSFSNNATATNSTPFKFGDASSTATATTSVQSATKSSETPKPGLFSALVETGSTSGSAPKENAASQSGPATTRSAGGFSFAGASKTPEAPKQSHFGGFNTPPPANSAEAEKVKGNIFSAAQPKTGNSVFSQPSKAPNVDTNGPSKSTPAFSFSSSSVTEASKGDAVEPSTMSASDPTPKATPSSNLFSVSKEQTPARATPAPLPALFTDVQQNELPKIPKAFLPSDWNVQPADNGGGDGLFKQIVGLTEQLRTLNERYLEKLKGLPLTADWASLSKWHCEQGVVLKTKIDIAKKQRAALQGVTGSESILSTKRKALDDGPEAQDATPSITKRARATEAPSTPTPQPSAPAPRFNPAPTTTSNIFAKAIGNNASTPSEPKGPTVAKLSAPPTAEPSEPAPATTGFRPSFASSAVSSSSTNTGATGFVFSGATSTAAKTDFASQFAKKAKSVEELAAERKAKAMAEDYDSDEETKAEWSARYDKKEAERREAEKQQASAGPTSFVPSSFNKPSTVAAPASNPFSSFGKPTSGASTPTTFSPRVGSPALSTGGQSVFDAPTNGQTPGTNIFGHLSSGPSSNNQDDSEADDDEDHNTGDSEKDKVVGSVKTATSPKPKFGQGSEPEEPLEEAMRHEEQQTNMKGSLLSRMTREENSEPVKSSIFSQTNGVQTTPNKPFPYFDFAGAGAKTAPPKSDSFAGDQTFKAGTPIKFGNTSVTAQKNAPTFSFQQSTPTKPDTTKPLFSFGATNGSSFLTPASALTGAVSGTSSVFSSRAGTPLSEAETSAASAAEDDEDSGKQEQIDLSQLTDAEAAANDVVFHTDVTLAKHISAKPDGSKGWVTFAKGPLWILKDKASNKVLVRLRLPSGATPINYNILPKLEASINANQKKAVSATRTEPKGGLEQIFYYFKTVEIAQEFAEKYNDSMPST